MGRKNKVLALCAFFVISIMIWLFGLSVGVPILAYHQVVADDDIYSISPDQFASQMRYLAENGYTAISLHEFFEARNGSGKLPDKPIIITFDDGYADNYLTALPIMEKYNMRASVFVVSGLMGQPTYLSWDQVRAMQQRHIEIGSHTASHAALSELALDERVKEVVESKATIEHELGSTVEFLAFPFGKFDGAMPDILRQAGYRGALTGVTGLNISGENAYTLKRISIPRPKYGSLEFRLRLLRATMYSKLGI